MRAIASASGEPTLHSASRSSVRVAGSRSGACCTNRIDSSSIAFTCPSRTRSGQGARVARKLATLVDPLPSLAAGDVVVLDREVLAMLFGECLGAARLQELEERDRGGQLDRRDRLDQVARLAAQ